MGLTAGFLLGGAKAVVGSLWTVSEAPTALLMKKLYQNLLTQMDLSEALRQAQIWLRSLNKEEALSQVSWKPEMDAAGIREIAVENYRTWIQGQDGEQPFAHPYYWAGFQAFGSPEPIVNSES